MKYGLVLEGGGMRGAYTAGCLKWLLENNIKFDHGCAISATAVLIVYYTTGDKEALEKIGIELMCDENNVGLKPLFKEGSLLGYKHMFNELLVNVVPINEQKVRNSDMEMEFGIYELETDSTVWVNNQTFDTELKRLHASCVLPIAGRKVKIGNNNYIDGGVNSMMPIFRSIEKGNDKFFCITTKHESYVRKPNSALIAKLLSFLYRKYPNMVRKTNLERVDIYNREIDEVEKLVKEKKAMFMRPSVLFDVSRLSATKEQLTGLFNQGYMDCENKKTEIYDFFGIK